MSKFLVGIIFSVSILVLLASIMIPEAIANGLVDQSSIPPTGCMIPSGEECLKPILDTNPMLAQTFTPTANKLVGVDLRLGNVASIPLTGIITITITDGNPNVTPSLGGPFSQSVSVAQASSNHIEHFDFPAISLVAGNTYGIIVTSTVNHHWNIGGNVYDRGTAWEKGLTDTEYSTLDNDFYLITYSEQNQENGGEINSQVIGGEIIPIETTALLLAGVQTNLAWIVPAVVIASGIGIFLVKRK